MEVQVSSGPAVAWYGRGWARALSVVVLVAGLVMGGVGVAALLSARDTNDEASAMREQAAAVDDEAQDLEQQAEDAFAAADAATSEAEALDIDTTAVSDAVLAVRDDTDAAVAAGNTMTDCSSILHEDEFVSCTEDALVAFELSLRTQQETIAELRTEVAALEEAAR